MKQHETRVMALESLRAAPYNPRRISDRSLAGLGESIKRFGLVEPIVWNKQTGNVVGGHQRLRVLRAQGESEASVVVVDLAIGEEHALNVALNSPSIAGEWADDLDRLLGEIRADTPDVYDDLLLDDLRMRGDGSGDGERTADACRLTFTVSAEDGAAIGRHLKTLDSDKNVAIMLWLQASTRKALTNDAKK